MRLLRLATLSLVAGLLLLAGTSAASHRTADPLPAQAPPQTQSEALKHPLLVDLPQRPAARPRVGRAPRPAHAHHPVRTKAQTPVRISPKHIDHDSYPYRASQTNDHDAWGFTQRQCVSYVAWRLSAAGHAISSDRDGWGSASNWDSTANRLGLAVDRKPLVGAIAQWDAGETSTVWVGRTTGVFTAGGFGHVGFVTEVYPDGSVQVAQYNATGNRAFSSMHLRAPRFLHLR